MSKGIERRLGSRDWSRLRSLISSTSLSSFVDPADSLSEKLDLLVRPPSLNEEAVEFDSGNLRDSVLVESLAFGYRAHRVLGNSFLLAECGSPTWAIVNAYQSSFFAQRAILGLLGVSYAELQVGDKRHHCVVDFVPEASKKGRKDRSAHHGYTASTAKLHAVRQFKHLEWWSLLISQLGKLRGAPAWLPIVKALAQIDPKEISRHRNGVIYRHQWYFSDLVSQETVAEFGIRHRKSVQSASDLVGADEGQDGTAYFALLVTSLLRHMLLDSGSRFVQDQAESMLAAVANDAHTAHDGLQKLSSVSGLELGKL